jgi:hypothetical protein
MARDSKDEIVQGTDLPSQEVLNRVREYLIKGKSYQLNDEYKCYKVELNKDVKLFITNPKTQKMDECLISARTPTDCNIVILRELVLRAIQEGPASMKQDFFDESGTPRIYLTDDKGKPLPESKQPVEPLKIKVLKEDILPGSHFSFVKQSSQKRNPAVPHLIEV